MVAACLGLSETPGLHETATNLLQVFGKALREGFRYVSFYTSIEYVKGVTQSWPSRSPHQRRVLYVYLILSFI